MFRICADPGSDVTLFVECFAGFFLLDPMFHWGFGSASGCSLGSSLDGKCETDDDDVNHPCLPLSLVFPISADVGSVLAMFV